MKFEEVKQFLLKEMELHGSLNTWWMSDFYGNFCEFMGIPEIAGTRKSTTRHIRYYLNKMVKLGLFESQTCGTGYIGKTDFNSTHFKTWFKKEEKLN